LIGVGIITAELGRLHSTPHGATVGYRLLLSATSDRFQPRFSQIFHPVTQP